MSQLQSALNAAAEETKNRLSVNVCKVCYLLSTLDESDAQALRIAIDNKSITNIKLKQVIRDTLNYETGYSLDRHRRKMCIGTNT